jgi:lactoylglutathione lyase
MRPQLEISQFVWRKIMKHKAGSIALGHTSLSVSDLDVSEGFYQEVLGLRVAEESLQLPFRYATMARDGKSVLTLWEQSSGSFKKCLPGLHHLAFEADSVEELNRTKAILENLGLRYCEQGRLHTNGSRSSTCAIHFKDPDGIGIEVYSPHCAETALAPKWVGCLDGARSRGDRKTGDSLPALQLYGNGWDRTREC